MKVPHPIPGRPPIPFADCPRICLANGDHATYRHLRAIETGLVSCCDGSEPPLVLTILVDGKPMGAVSFVVTENVQKAVRRRYFGRIDLVIVERFARDLGLGRLLILSVIAHMLRANAKELYSLSCLAAHHAVAKVLEEIGFTGVPRKDRNFKHMTFPIDAESLEPLCLQVEDALVPALKRTHFRVRQRMGASGEHVVGPTGR